MVYAKCTIFGYLDFCEGVYMYICLIVFVEFSFSFQACVKFCGRLRFGPRVPRRLVEPLQKLPFGRLVLWGPADPEEVTRWYLNFSEAWAFLGRDAVSPYSVGLPGSNKQSFFLYAGDSSSWRY